MRRTGFAIGVLLGLLLPGLLPATGCLPPAKVRVGLVDGAKLIQVTKRGKRIREQIQQETAKLSRQLVADQQIAKAAAEELEALLKAPSPDPAKVAEKRRALRVAEERLRALHSRLESQLNQHGEKLLAEFKEEVRKVALRVREREGLDLVIMTARGESVWVWPVTDLTEKLVQELDAAE